MPSKRGRPSQFHERYIDEARKLGMLGATDAECAAFWGVSETTVNNWKHQHPEFLESLNAGKMAADANVADRLYQRAMGYSHKAVKIFMPANAPAPVYADYVEHYPPDTAAGIFWLKNRRKADWRDKLEHTGEDGGPITVVVRKLADG